MHILLNVFIAVSISTHIPHIDYNTMNILTLLTLHSLSLLFSPTLSTYTGDTEGVLRYTGSAQEGREGMTALAFTSSIPSMNPLYEKRGVMVVLALMVVLLFWLFLSQFVIPASKDSNIRLRILEQESTLSEFDRLVIMNQIKKKEKGLKEGGMN